MSVTDYIKYKYIRYYLTPLECIICRIKINHRARIEDMLYKEGYNGRYINNILRKYNGIAVITGSFILKYLTRGKWKEGDIDILYVNDRKNSKIDFLKDIYNNKEYVSYGTYGCITELSKSTLYEEYTHIEYKSKIQVSVIDNVEYKAKTPVDHISLFDLDICKAYYDGYNIHMTQKTKKYIKRKIVLIKKKIYTII